MNQATFDNIVGKKKGTSPLLKDNDKDGVMNMLDCKPNDPNKQGFIHNIGAKIAEKVGATETAERIRERGAQVDETREIAKEERYKQEKETAVYREKIRAEREREAIKNPKPSGFSQLKTNFGGMVNTLSKVEVKPIKVSSKRRKLQDRNRDGVPDIFGRPSDRNRDGIPDVLGVSLGATPRKAKAKPFRMF